MNNKNFLNYFLVILFFILVIIVGVTSSSKPFLNIAPTNESIIPGDINGDKKISSIDYILVKKYLLEPNLPSDDILIRSDIDYDNEITANDYSLIKKVILGLLPIPDPIIREYTINYYGNGETSGSLSSHTCITGESCTIKVNTFNKPGYTFQEWTTNSDGTPDTYNWTNWSGIWNYTNGQYGINNHTLNLYAVWKENNVFTINYYGNGAVSGGLSSHTCTTGESCAIKANTFGKPGYIFQAWTTNSDGTVDGYNWTNWSGIWNYTNGQYGINNHTLNLYAVWKAVQTYTITYNANGGTGAPAVQSYEYATTGSINLSTVIPTRSGYTFLGWSTTSTATTPSYSAGQAWLKSNANNYVLYAIWKQNTPPQEELKLEMHFINPGGFYDDAILIRTNKATIWIDGGRGKEVIVPYLKSKNVTTIDYIIGSHTEYDHIDAEGEIIKNFNVKNVIYPNDIYNCGCRCDNTDVGSVLSGLKSKGMKAKVQPVPSKLDIGDMSLYFIAPTKLACNKNNNSFVFILKFGDVSFMFTGDSDSPLQDVTTLTNNAKKLGLSNIQVDVVKYPHHGNEWLSDNFINTVNAKYYVVPNMNRSDVPKSDFREKMKARGVPIYRQSDSKTGNLLITSNGKTITFTKDVS